MSWRRAAWRSGTRLSRRWTSFHAIPPPSSPSHNTPSLSFSLLFAGAFAGIALSLEGVDKYVQWADGLSAELLFSFSESVESVGVAFGAGMAAYMAARKTLTSTAVMDALTARPDDIRKIFCSAGGRTGCRTALYYATLKVVSGMAAAAVLPGTPFEVMFLVPPAAFFIIIVCVIPILLPAYVCGYAVGSSLGTRAIAAAAHQWHWSTGGHAWLHRAFYSHPIDVAFTANPFLLRGLASILAVGALMPRAREEIGDIDLSTGGRGGGGGGGEGGEQEWDKNNGSWRYSREYKWSSRDHGGRESGSGSGNENGNGNGNGSGSIPQQRGEEEDEGEEI